MLYGPSYVSRLTALREYGLIPERVDVVESMTTHLTKSFQNEAGRFEYYHCAKDYYPIGITQREEEGVSYLIATPEKALCDYIITTPRLPLRFLKDTYMFLEEDFRLDMDAFRSMNIDIFRQCAVSNYQTSLLVRCMHSFFAIGKLVLRDVTGMTSSGMYVGMCLLISSIFKNVSTSSMVKT